MPTTIDHVTPEASATTAPRGLFSPPVVTVPNAITVMRLACIPLFVWLLFARDDRASAAWLLGALGATDWVDGWVARRFDQISELGKVLDPTVDRLLFIVGAGGIIIDGAVPLWFCWAIVVREVAVGGAMVVFTAMGMQRFPVTWWGKTGTFLLMFALPGLLLGASDFRYADAVTTASWVLGIPGLFISWYAAFMYVPTMRASLRTGRESRKKDA